MAEVRNRLLAGQWLLVSEQQMTGQGTVAQHTQGSRHSINKQYHILAPCFPGTAPAAAAGGFTADPEAVANLTVMGFSERQVSCAAR